MKLISNLTTETRQMKSLTGEEKELIRKQIEEEERRLVESILKENDLRKKENIKKMFEEKSLINVELQKATLDNYVPTTELLQKAKKIAIKYVNSYSKDNPINILLFGNYGTGKSHLSVGITKALMDKEITSIFISMPKLHTKLRDTYNKKSQQSEAEIMKALEDIDLLVLDDIGAEKDTEWANSKLFEILDSRQGKHTIFTTNLNENNLKAHVGERNYSRLMYNTHLVKMTGDDYRLRK